MSAQLETLASNVVQTQTDADRLDPWLQDGNVVLAVEQKYFRVHRSVLSSYSEVFKDMFECPAPSSEEFIEQCPVVHLHGDTATDVQIILKSMYDRSYPFPYYEKMPLPIVATFLHLGEKYAIQRFLDEAKARLSLSAGSKSSLDAADRPWEFLPSGTLLLFPGITGGDQFNFQVMNLLREMDLRSALPFAMYQCVIACPLTSVVDGYKFDGTICTLSPANLRSYILVKDIIDSFRIQLAQSLRVLSSRCNCVYNVCQLWSDATVGGQPFGPWRHEWDKLFCDACRTHLNKRRNAVIQKAWEQIPIAFGFESWAEVVASQMSLISTSLNQ